MRPIILSFCMLIAAPAPAAEILKQFSFDSTQRISEYRLSLLEIDPNFPSDWSGQGYLVLEMRASSPQRFDLRIHTDQGYSRVLLHPFPMAWIRAALPVAMHSEPPRTGADMAAVRPSAIGRSKTRLTVASPKVVPGLLPCPPSPSGRSITKPKATTKVYSSARVRVSAGLGTQSRLYQSRGVISCSATGT
jgi:hypothetical protein